MKRTNHKKSNRTDRPTLPELDQTKMAVLNSLTSLQSRRSYRNAMDELIEWYCSEPWLALTRGVVRYRLQLEAKKLAATTINVRLAAVRRLAYEAADTGLLRPELVAGIRRVKGVRNSAAASSIGQASPRESSYCRPLLKHCETNATPQSFRFCLAVGFGARRWRL